MGIPVYRGKGFLGAAREFVRDPIAFSAQKAETIGDFYRLRLPLRRLYVTTHPDVIRHVLQTHHRNFVKSPAYHELKLALGNGLVTNEGDSWFRQRRLAQPAFYKASLQGIFEKMVGVAQTFLQNLEDQEHKVVDISQLMMGVTSDIVLKALFSVENQGDKVSMYRQIMEAQEYIMHRTSHPLLKPFNYINGRHRKFLKVRRDFDEMAYRFIQQHREAVTPPDDFLTMLIQAKDADTGETMSNTQIRDETITLFAAGHETSANALSWALMLLSQHPEVVENMRSEIQEVVGNRSIQFAELQQLQYTRRVIEESMRLFPPAYAVGREAAVDEEILGEKIPRKAIVFISIYAVHHSRKYWDNPEIFDPERFSPERAKHIPRFAYMPFGAGPRMCIGEHFAMMEMQLLLALLIRRFDFELMDSLPIPYQALVTMKPSNGIKMKLKKQVDNY